MKSKIKRIVSLILIVCMSATLGLYGCSKDKTNTEETANSNDTVTTVPTDIPEMTEPSEKPNTTETTDTTEATDTEETTMPVEKSSLIVISSKGSGVYEEEFDLEITCDGEADIYYTIDGSNPTTSATKMLYSAPIKVTDRSMDENYVSAVDPFLYDAANVKVNSTRDGFVSTLDSAPSKEAVDKCTVIRAAAIDNHGLYTTVVTNTYFIGGMEEHIAGIQESCKAAGTSLAILSLSMDYEDLFSSETGIYVKGDTFEKSLKEYLASGEKFEGDTSRRLLANYSQKGSEWERNVHLDFFESNGTTTTCELQQDSGIRIQGNYSRSDLQKGFRLFAKEKYGKKNFEYAFFGEGLKDDSGETITKFKTLTLRNGGNTAFTTKYSDTYWQSLIKDLDCETQTSRPCIVYLDGEYWGLYVLQEDYSQEYFENTHGVNKDDVVLYKGDAEAIKLGYKLDLGDLPEAVVDESYYFQDLFAFFQTHKDLSKTADYEAFAKLVDIESARDYFAVQIWINNKWDWPGKNWSLWKTAKVEESNSYADGKWRFLFYDVEFGGVSGAGDARTNTIKEDNYKPFGLLDKDTTNPAVLIYVYLMTNENFREDFAASLQALSKNNFNKEKALPALDIFKNTYSPLYDQFFTRYHGAGSTDNAINGGYASYQCIKDFLGLRADHIQPMLDYVNEFYK
ncbi:MAG: CotH kinase family protein [Mobilitalea sp.]